MICLLCSKCLKGPSDHFPSPLQQQPKYISYVTSLTFENKQSPIKIIAFIQHKTKNIICMINHHTNLQS